MNLKIVRSIAVPKASLEQQRSYSSLVEQSDKSKFELKKAIGTTATTTLIRVNAALLFATRYLEKCGTPQNVIDGFWTITGYFNSLRELGGASTQILDDVQGRFGYLAKTKFSGLYPGVDPDKRLASELASYYEDFTAAESETVTEEIGNILCYK